jgi:hypothetical protein
MRLCTASVKYARTEHPYAFLKGFIMKCKIPAFLSACAIGFLSGASLSAAAQTPSYLASFPNFEAHLTPQQLPGDVDVALEQKLQSEKKRAEVQRLFDLWAWQAFISLNWPTDSQGKALPNAKSPVPPAWTLWTESPDLFLKGGARPAFCDTPPQQRALSLIRNPVASLIRGLAPFKLPADFDKRAIRLLANNSAVGEHSALVPTDDIKQAFSGPIIDQNGDYVFYEILVNKNEVDYICENSLYSIKGQETFATTHSVVDLPAGVDTQDASGAFEIKLAWKILVEGNGQNQYPDDPSRYLTLSALIPDPSTVGGTKQVKVGLVGMHIAHNAASSKQWIWATFEQVDNLDVDAVAHPNIHPSFFDPLCFTCAPNQQPASTGVNTWANVPKTQAMRSIPIPKDKMALNEQAQSALAKAGSPLQFYQLIDTQWPMHPSVPPSPWNSGLPDAVNNKAGGDPTPVFLTNITMETYFQGGIEAACTAEELPTGVKCPPAPFASADTPNDKTTTVDTTPIFASESCTGCHSSAPLHGAKPVVPGVNTLQLTGDFSWLFSQKAQ